MLLLGKMERIFFMTCLSAAVAAVELPVKLGAYDYQTQESTPVIYNGRLLMMESMFVGDPEFNPTLCPASNSYLRVRDQATGVAVVNISSSCGAAFGAAFVQTNDEGVDTLFIYGSTGRFSGACSGSAVNCTVGAFYSSHPALIDSSWTFLPRVVGYGHMIYNQDVAHVGAPTGTALVRATDPVLPPHQWVMILEGDVAQGFQFAVSNLSDPTDKDGWQGLPYSQFQMDNFGNGQVGACPSIRFDPSTGYYYVLTGGDKIVVLRSKTLTKGSWQLATAASPSGAIIVPDRVDCVQAGAPYGAWFTPSPVAQKLMDQCTSGEAPFNTTKGFGNDSDVDLSDVLIGPSECAGFASSGILAKSAGMAALCQNVTSSGQPAFATLFQYGSGDQRSFGFSNLAIAPGRMFDVLASYF